MRIFDSKSERDQEIITGAPLLRDHLNDTSRHFFDEVCNGLAQLSIPFKLESSLVRGLDYYTHTAFEFVTENLERILERGGTLPLQRAITVVQQIASALQVSHNAGITHRDIKPANVLLNDAGEVKLTDFGIASAETLDSMTSENTTVGTPLYMSPEQIQGSDAIDGRSDLYSLGCLLYEVLTGATPFQGKSTFEIFNGHINEAHEPIASHMDEFP